MIIYLLSKIYKGFEKCWLMAKGFMLGNEGAILD